MKTKNLKIKRLNLPVPDKLPDDFMPIDENTTIDDITIRNIRGSIRLRTGRILLPIDVARWKKKVLSKKLP